MHVLLGAISQPKVSHYLPSVGNLFMMVLAMTEMMSENRKLLEIFPGYNSLSFSLYVGHLVFYQILRAREAVSSGSLSKVQKRVLGIYKSIGEPEAWSIPTPLVGFIESLSAYKSSDPLYSWIVPSLPNFGTLNANQGLDNIQNVVGGNRFPLIPAMQEFLRRLGADATGFDTSGNLVPVNNATNAGRIPANQNFCGITASTAATGNFQAIAFNEAWNPPTEMRTIQGSIDLSTIRRVVARLSIPEVTATSNLDDLQLFLGFNDGRDLHWMKHLLQTGRIVSQFWEGQVNLSQLSPFTTLNNFTRVEYDAAAARTAAADTWFTSRTSWSMKAYGYSNDDGSLLEQKMAMTTAARCHYSANCAPAIAGNFLVQEEGPFFVDANAGIYEQSPNFVTLASTTVDPVARFDELIMDAYKPIGPHPA
jgi:hypothetical protein